MRRALLVLFVLVLTLAVAPSFAQPITLNPSSGKPGDTLTVTATGPIPVSAGMQIRFQPGGALVASNVRPSAGGPLLFDLNVQPNAAPGAYMLMVLDRAGRVTARQANAFQVVAAASFGVRIQPRPITLAAGGPTLNVTVSTIVQGALSGPIAYAFELPAGISAGGARTANPPYAPIVFPFSAAASVAPGTYRGILQADHGGTSRAFPVDIVVRPGSQRGDFALQVVPASLALQPGQSGVVSVRVVGQGPISGNVQVQVQPPNGFTFQWTTQTIGINQQRSLTITAQTGATPANSTSVTFQGTHPTAGSRSANLALDVRPPAQREDWELQVVPASLALEPGQSGNVSVRVVGQGPISGNVQVQVQPPNGFTFQWTTRTIGINQQRNLTITAQTGATPANSTSVTFQGTHPTAGSRSATLDLEVRPPAEPPGFDLVVEPPEVSLPPGAQDQVTVRVVGRGGFSERVQVRTPNPPGVSFSPRDLSLAPGESRPVGVRIAGNAPQGSLDAIFQGRAGNLQASDTLKVRISAAPDFTLVVQPPTLRLVPGEATAVTVALRPTNGFDGTVQVAVEPPLDLALSSTAFSLRVGGAPQTLSVTALEAATAGNLQVLFRGRADVVGERTATLGVAIPDLGPGEPPAEPPGPTEPPPRELPRVDRLEPDRVRQGERAELRVLGQNFTVGSTLAFGDGVTVLRFLVRSPTEGTAEILATPAAPPGVRSAVIANRLGRNEGPGGLLVDVAQPPAQPPPPISTEPPKPIIEPPVLEQETGEILLGVPEDPWNCKIAQEFCDDPTLRENMLFTWWETNPGLAKVFLFEIVDGEGHVLFSAQTKEGFHQFSAADLASLPRIEEFARLAVRSFGQSLSAGETPGPIFTSNVHPAAITRTNLANQTRAEGLGAPGFNNAAELSNSMAAARPAVSGAMRALDAGRTPRPNEVYWRVSGWADEKDDNGQKTGNVVEVETSVERAILIPLPPNGLSCEGGPSTANLGTLVGVRIRRPFGFGFKPVSYPCDENSPNICSGDNKAAFQAYATIDLTRVPFDLGQVGTLGTSHEVTFNHVFVNWGDGTPAERLTVSGYASTSLSAVHLYRPGEYDPNKDLEEQEKAKWTLAHVYYNQSEKASNLDEDEQARYELYTVRVFAVANPEELSPQDWLYLSNSTGAHGQGGSNDPQRAQSQSGPSQSSAQGPGGTASSSTGDLVGGGNTAVLDALGSSMFTVACTEAKVYNALGAGADDDVHLVDARIVFPTDPPETRGTPASAESASPAAARVRGEASPAPATTTSARGAGSQRRPTATPQSSPVLQGIPQRTGQPQLGPSQRFPDLFGALTGHVPTVTECAQAFRATLRLEYWGHGQVEVDWYLDGSTQPFDTSLAVLPRVSTADGEAGAAPAFIDMTSVLPTILRSESYRVKARVRVRPAATPPEGQGRTLAPPLPKGSQFGAEATQGPGSTYNNLLLTAPIDPEVVQWAEERRYRVRPLSKDVPCVVVVHTDQGDFEISDFTEFDRTGEGEQARYSGTGLLNLFVPTAVGGYKMEPVPVSFTDWQLSVDPEVDLYRWERVAGTLVESPAMSPLDPYTFRLKIDQVAITETSLTLDGNIRLTEAQGFLAQTASQLPAWPFQGMAISPQGDFRYTSQAEQEVQLDASPFYLQIASADLDFSRLEGEEPAATPGGNCAFSDSGEEWVGIRIDGTLESLVEVSGQYLLQDFPFAGWGIGMAGLSVREEQPDYQQLVVGSGGFQLAVDGFTFDVCHGALTPDIGLMVSFPPLIDPPIQGTIQIGNNAAVTPNFNVQPWTKDFGNVRAEFKAAQFLYNSSIGQWNVTADADITLRMPDHGPFANQVVLTDQYYGFKIGIDGNLYNPQGTGHFWNGTVSSTTVGGYPVQVTKIGVGTVLQGPWFGMLSDVTVGGGNVPGVADRETRYTINPYQASLASYVVPPPQVLALYQEQRGGEERVDYAVLRTYDPPWADPEYRGPPPQEYTLTEWPNVDFNSDCDDAGLCIQEIDVEFDVSSAVHVQAHLVWMEYPGGFRFLGEGEVGIAGMTLDADFVYGQDVNTGSYWLGHMRLELGPSGIALGSSGLAMFAFGGGLAYNVAGNSFDLELAQVQPDGQNRYLVRADVDIGTVDGNTVYARGGLTIVIGPNGGFRFDLDAWILTTNHEGQGNIQLCIQYLNGAFDAGLAVHYDILNGLISIDAPLVGGNDVCLHAAARMHFGSDGWFVHMGTKQNPLQGHVIIVDATAYLMIDPQGIVFGGAIEIDIGDSGDFLGFDYEFSVHGWAGMELGLQWSPKFYLWGEFGLGLDIHVEVRDPFFDEVLFGLNGGFSGKIQASLPPVKMCASGKMYIEICVIGCIGGDLSFSNACFEL